MTLASANTVRSDMLSDMTRWMLTPVRWPWLLRLHLVIIAVSLATGLWTAYCGFMVNRDAITFFTAAEAFAEGRVADALEAYKWPGYPLLLAIVVWLGAPTLYIAAQTVSILSVLAIQLGLIGIARRLGLPAQIVVLVGLLAIAHPGLIEHRGLVIRDVPYAAWFVLTVYCAVRGTQEGILIWGALALIAALVATSFRLEGAVLVAFVPLLLLLSNAQRGAWKALLILVGLVLCAFPAAAVGLWLGRVDLGGLFQDGLAAGIDQLRGLLNWHLSFDNPRMVALRDEVLWPNEYGNAKDVYLVTFLYLTVEALFSILFGVLFVLLLVGLGPFWAHANQTARSVLIVFGGFCTLAVYSAVLANTYVEPRHVLAISLVLLLPVAFGAARAMGWISDGLGRLRLAVLMVPGVTVSLVMIGLAGMPTGQSALFLIEASEALERLSSPDDRILTTDARILYYADRAGRMDRRLNFAMLQGRDAVPRRNWSRFDVVVIHAEAAQRPAADALRDRLAAHHTARISNTTGGAVVDIYDMRSDQ
ncbi:MAG: hypothetical protein AAFX39_13050 [Pseudomonadota bacterium]